MELNQCYTFPSLVILLKKWVNEINQLVEVDIKNVVLIRVIEKLKFQIPDLRISQSTKKRILTNINQSLLKPISITIEDEILMRSHFYLTKLTFNEIEEQDVQNILNLINNEIRMKKNISPKFGLVLLTLLVNIDQRHRSINQLGKYFDLIQNSITPNQRNKFINFFELFQKYSANQVWHASDLEFFFNSQLHTLDEIWMVSSISNALNSIEFVSVQPSMFNIIYTSFLNLIDNLIHHKKNSLEFTDCLLIESLININPSFISYQFGDSTILKLFNLSDVESFLSQLNYVCVTVYELIYIADRILDNFQDVRYNRLTIFLLHNALETCCKYILTKEIGIKAQDVSKIQFEEIIEKIREKRKVIPRNGQTLHQAGFKNEFFGDIHNFREQRNILQHKGIGLIANRKLTLHYLNLIIDFCDFIFKQNGKVHLNSI